MSTRVFAELGFCDGLSILGMSCWENLGAMMPLVYLLVDYTQLPGRAPTTENQ